MIPHWSGLPHHVVKADGHCANRGQRAAGAADARPRAAFAERARGLAEISLSSAVTGAWSRYESSAHLRDFGRCRDPPPALARSTRKFLTIAGLPGMKRTPHQPAAPLQATRSRRHSARSVFFPRVLVTKIPPRP